MKSYKQYFLILVFTLFFSVFLFPNFAEAKDPKPTIRDATFSAKYAGQDIPDPIVIPQGETRTVNIKFKNTGTKTWNQTGRNYVSGYTMEDRYRASGFAGSSWISKKQTPKIKKTTAPGEIGILPLEISVPKNIFVGEYTEEFYLASENNTWVDNGYFFVKVKVVPAKEEVKAETTVSEETTEVEKNEEEEKSIIRAEKVLLTQEKTSAVGGDEIGLVAIFKNSGTEPWKTASLVANKPNSLAATNKLTFADNTWKSDTLIAEHKQEVAPGAFFRQMFKFRAPEKKGEYILSLKPMVNGDLLDTDAEVIVTVTEDAPNHYAAPVFKNKTIAVDTVRPILEKEPRIRVGLWKDAIDVELYAEGDDYLIFDGTKEKIILNKGERAVISYKNGLYTYKSGAISFTAESFVRWLPKQKQNAVFVLVNYDRHASWKGKLNFNKYRGAGEFRTTEDGKNRYVINDVLFEDYVAGIGETSNAAPMEYIKALLTAARTYAYYISENTNKHAARHFNVVAHTGDQLYLGYNNEVLAPRVVQAAKATRGYMVTHDNNIVITPYFGNSDGKTRTWKEVWGGSNKPWIQPVKAHYDLRDGKRMFGHGVGFSQRDAAYRADEEGVSWKELLQYYYTDVEVDRIYL